MEDEESPEQIELVRAYAQAQGLWRDAAALEPLFTDTLELDMSSIEPSLAGPKRPQDRVLLSQVDEEFCANFTREFGQDLGDLKRRCKVDVDNDGVVEAAETLDPYCFASMREMVLSGASSFELRNKAIQAGMMSLRMSGLQKVRDGMTTVEEIVRETVL